MNLLLTLKQSVRCARALKSLPLDSVPVCWFPSAFILFPLTPFCTFLLAISTKKRRWLLGGCSVWPITFPVRPLTVVSSAYCWQFARFWWLIIGCIFEIWVFRLLEAFPSSGLTCFFPESHAHSTLPLLKFFRDGFGGCAYLLESFYFPILLCNFSWDLCFLAVGLARVYIFLRASPVFWFPVGAIELPLPIFCVFIATNDPNSSIGGIATQAFPFLVP